jgi:hypothetical protein
VIWLHTFGAEDTRYTNSGQGRPAGPPRLPRERRPEIITRIPDDPENMPTDIRYDDATLDLHIGHGIIRPVTPEVWAYEVGGKPVIRQWFSYRQRTRQYERWSSPLDDTRVDHWTIQLTGDLLNLIHVLTLLVDLEPRQAVLLEQVCNGPLVTVADLKDADVLPTPTWTRKPPRLRRQDELPYS